ncbi:MAG: pyridoxamine 5'-phosphate oxidase family protein [Pseudomonadota bacterium]
MADEYSSICSSHLNRRPDRGSYDRQDVYEILDAAVVCHIGYTVEGQPYATPTLFWREGDDLYWHGSRHGKMISTLTKGQRVCVTVTHLDAFNLGRSGKGSSVQYRSVMAFGTTMAVDGRDEKKRQMGNLINRKFPGRTRRLRPIHNEEIDQILMIRMPIEEAAAKVKSEGVIEASEEDYDIAAWAGVIPIETHIGRAVPDQRLHVAPALPVEAEAYQEGRSLADVLSEMAKANQS